MCREALSARIDGEREQVASEQVDAHLTVCEQCRGWQLAAIESARRLRLRTVSQTPDLTAAVLARLDSVTLEPAPRRRALTLVRALLAAVGVAQCGVGAAQLAGYGFGMSHMAGHVADETAAWQLAIGIGLVVGALRPAAVLGMIPVLGGFLTVLAVFVARDLADGAVTVSRAASHLVTLAGLMLLVLFRVLSTRPAGSPLRAGDADDEPLPLPPGARYGRRTGHLRTSHDPAA